jgi:hypothetical protein
LSAIPSSSSPGTHHTTKVGAYCAEKLSSFNKASLPAKQL